MSVAYLVSHLPEEICLLQWNIRGSSGKYKNLPGLLLRPRSIDVWVQVGIFKKLAFFKLSVKMTKGRTLILNRRGDY
jgi:hypothetical protein